MRHADEPFQFEVTASTNRLVLIQTASVLAATNWNAIQTITLWKGRSTITDQGAADFPIRFYRATLTDLTGTLEFSDPDTANALWRCNSSPTPARARETYFDDLPLISRLSHCFLLAARQC